MARNVDIVVSAKDNMSDALKSIQRNQTAFRKDLSELNKELKTFSTTKASLKIETKQAQAQLKQAEKDFKKLGDELSRQKYLDAQLNYDNARQNLSAVSSAARKAQKDIEGLTVTTSKAENRVGGAFGGGGGMLGKLGQAGAFKILGDTAANMANAYVGSAFGSEAGTMFGSALGSIGSGAAIGTMLGGPVGTAIGAVAGAAVGAIGGATEIYKNRDEAFKGVVKSEFDRVKNETASMLQGGSSTAAERELIGLKGEVVFGGADEAKKVLADVQRYALDTPFNYSMMAQQAVSMRTSGIANDDIMKRLRQIGDLSMGDSAAFESIALQYIQATAKGKAQTQDLRIIAEKGVEIYDALAAVKGTDKEGIFKLLDKGQIFADDLNKAFDLLTGDGGKFKGMLDQMAGSFTMLTEQRAELEEILNASMGEGFNEARKPAIQADIDFINSAYGDALKEINRASGAFEAHLENEKERLLREAIQGVIDNNKELIEQAAAGSMEAQVELGKLKKEAEIKAQKEYTKIEGFQLQLEADKALVQSTREALKDDWYNYGYSMEQEFNKGRAAAKNYTSNPDEYYKDNIYYQQYKKNPRQHAYGLSYVPYDNYPALLHQGEKVLTASEARSADTSGGVTISGNTFVIREEADIQKIGEALYYKLKQAQEGYAYA